MTNIFKSFLRHGALALCLTALLGTWAQAQIQRSVGTGKMTLTTAKGTTVYNHDALSTIADFPNNQYSFYFKIPGFRSGNKATDARMFDVVDGAEYSFVSFDGNFAEPFKRPAPGQTGSARMTGQLKMHGKVVKTELVAKTYMHGNRLVIETPLQIATNATPSAAKASAKLGVTKPVSITITATY